MITTLLFFSHMIFAQEEKSAFERSLERDTSVLSEESWVKIKGKRYRKFVFNNGRYYVVFTGAGRADVYCSPPDGYESEQLVEDESRNFRRNAAFVRAFHEACANVKDNRRTDLHITPEMGLDLVDGAGAKPLPKHHKKP